MAHVQYFGSLGGVFASVRHSFWNPIAYLCNGSQKGAQAFPFRRVLQFLGMYSMYRVQVASGKAYLVRQCHYRATYDSTGVGKPTWHGILLKIRKSTTSSSGFLGSAVRVSWQPWHAYLCNGCQKGARAFPFLSCSSCECLQCGLVVSGKPSLPI